jgi:AAA domain
MNDDLPSKDFLARMAEDAEKRIDGKLNDQVETERQRHRNARRPQSNGHDAHSGIRFPLLDASALTLNGRSAYLVKNILPTEGLIVVWGPPKCGKSFWILDIGFHIALGWEYRGRRVKQGLVVYIGCEGAFAVPARVEAFRQAKIGKPIDPECFKLILTRLNLIADVDQLIADIGAQLGDRHPAILIVDTLNRSLAGSESSDEDMGNYVKAADKIRERFSCAVAVIHHCGYNASHPRGHTSLLGAADAQITVKKTSQDLSRPKSSTLKTVPKVKPPQADSKSSLLSATMKTANQSVPAFSNRQKTQRQPQARKNYQPGNDKRWNGLNLKRRLPKPDRYLQPATTFQRTHHASAKTYGENIVTPDKSAKATSRTQNKRLSNARRLSSLPASGLANGAIMSG